MYCLVVHGFLLLLLQLLLEVSGAGDICRCARMLLLLHVRLVLLVVVVDSFHVAVLRAQSLDLVEDFVAVVATPSIENELFNRFAL